MAKQDVVRPIQKIYHVDRVRAICLGPERPANTLYHFNFAVATPSQNNSIEFRKVYAFVSYGRADQYLPALPKGFEGLLPRVNLRRTVNECRGQTSMMK